MIYPTYYSQLYILTEAMNEHKSVRVCEYYEVRHQAVCLVS